MKKSQVVFRIAKLKSFGNIGGAAGHNLRTRPTPNADPDRKNIVLKGSSDSAEEVVQDVKDKLQHLKIRSNAVLGVEVLISASPEYFRPKRTRQAGSWDKKRLEEWRKSVEPFIKEKFPHAVSVVLHLDESTPHYQIIDVPLNDKTGRLDARTKYGGREALREWQTEAHKCVSHLGIERGVLGSNAKHTSLKKWYGLLNSEYIKDLPDVSDQPEPLAPRKLSERNPLSEIGKKRRKEEANQEEKIAERTKELAELRAFKLKNYGSLAAKHAYTELYLEQKKSLEKRNEYLSKVNEELSAIAKRLRPIDPRLVLERLYSANKDQEGDEEECYRVEGHVVSIQAAKTITAAGNAEWLLDGQQKGRGAIDLVMKLNQCDYKTATLLLSQYFDVNEVVADSAAKQISVFEDDLKQAITTHTQQQEQQAQVQQQAQAQQEQAQKKLRRIIVTQAAVPPPRPRGGG